MKLLALDSSGLTASVAIVDEDKVVAEYTVNHKKTHSQTLVPMMDEITRMTELDLSTLDAVCVAKGPGSFTGLRIGAATAKGLGLALSLPIVEVPTTDAMAYQFVGTDRIVCPLMDARRNQTYTGIYAFQKDEMEVLMPASALAIEDIISKLNEIGKPVILLGDGIPVFMDAISKELKVDYYIAPLHHRMQSAAALGVLGLTYLKAGKTVPASEHVPEYLRLSQAERERNEKE